MSRLKLRAAFTRLMLVTPTVPLLGCDGGSVEPHMERYTVERRTLPDGRVYPQPDVSCDELCMPLTYNCYTGEVCTKHDDPGQPVVTVECSVRCDGRRPEGLVSHGRVEGVASALGAHFAHKYHLEAASVPAFERLAQELAAHGAPARLVRAALRSAREEVRHARAMEALARRHGAPIPDVVVEPFRERSLEAMALENAEEGCVREFLGALMAGWQARTAGDAEVREAMAPIAREELRHSELSWEIDAWASLQLSAAARARLQEARVEALRDLEREIDRSSPPEVLVARAGMPSREDARMLLRGLAEVVLPSVAPAAA